MPVKQVDKMIEVKPMIEIMEKIFSDKKVESVSVKLKDVDTANKAVKELRGYNIAWEFSGNSITFLIVENDE